MSNPAVAPRPHWYRWYICGLLLLATAINYMDRQTLSSAAARVITDFDLSRQQYGQIEQAFSLAFAGGALLFGFVADLVTIRWLYPLVLVAWSIMGIATGSVTTFTGLLICRTLLGLFEAGHWPCALKTTQRILPPNERTLGNSILQSGSSIGAIITPLIMAWLLTDEPGSWRFAFQLIGVVGMFWGILWLAAVRERDLALDPHSPAGTIERAPTSPFILARRIIVLIVVVLAINIYWHFFRAWLPLFLQEGRGYTEKVALQLTSSFYIATDVGCLAAGWASLALIRSGWSVSWARWLTFTGCALFTALSISMAFTPAGPALIAQLWLAGAGALGLLPCYYALSQEISVKHQGKLTGFLGAIAWIGAAPLHPLMGRLVDQTKSYDLGLILIGFLPLSAAAVWFFVWDFDRSPAHRPTG